MPSREQCMAGLGLFIGFSLTPIIGHYLMRKMMPPKKIMFVDVENVGAKNIERFIVENKDAILVLITGTQTSVKFGPEMLSEMSRANSRVEIAHADQTSDQLADKILTAKVGEYRQRYPKATLTIVSKDKGFDAFFKESLKE